MHIIAGIFKGHPLLAPKGQATRPTSSRLRESLFNICQQEIEDARFLDLFAGSGAMGLEALSRGAKSATFIDSSRESIACIKKNIECLGVKKNIEIFQGDVFMHLDRLIGQKYDLIYADPPYDALMRKGKEIPISYSNQILKIIDENSFLFPLGSLFIEESSATELPKEGLKTLELKSIRKMGRSMLYHYLHK